MEIPNKFDNKEYQKKYQNEYYHEHMNNEELEIHWLKHGRHENRQYKSDIKSICHTQNNDNMLNINIQSDIKFDIVICHGPNDDDMLNINIELLTLIMYLF